MWEHYDDLPFEVFCVDSQGVKHLLRRHRLESEAVHSMNTQNRSGGYSAEYWNWRQVQKQLPLPGIAAAKALMKGATPAEAALVELSTHTRGSKNMVTHIDAVSAYPYSMSDADERVLTVIKPREVKCMLCNDCGTAQGCTGCHKVDPYLKAYSNSLVNDETGDPHS